MISLQNFTFEFGSRALYKNCNWHIKPNEKIGLIGPNGSGKSTLLRVIAGEYQLTSGHIQRRKNLLLGYLNQDLLSYQSDESIVEVAMQGFEKAVQLKHELDIIIEKMSYDHSDEVMNAYQQKQDEFEALDGYNIQHKAETVLEGLGFSTTDLLRPLSTFSGGWRMRVMLAKILLQQPDLLLLDEPTNHLDLPSIQWLEEYLENYSGTVIIVSHDRYFLDRVVNKIADVNNQQIVLYTGNYSFFLEEKAERNAMQKAQFKNQEKFIKEQEKLIDRFKAKASKAKMAQSRMKMLDKIERIEDVDDSVSQIRINLAFDKQPGKTIFEADNLSKAYPSGEILHKAQCKINRGDKIALIGANGKGKSTLLRIIAGTENFEGKCELGYNVIPSFFAQHQLEVLNLEFDMMQELQHTAPDVEDVKLRGLLGAFLFYGDDVFKKIKVLSGGEKSRVALAKTILTKANFLMLDEPTNHLDMQSVNTLIHVLRNYEGTLIVVSHDRYFLGAIANKIWYIEDKKVKEYPGTYEEYETWQLEKALAEKKQGREKIDKAETPLKVQEKIQENKPDNKKEKQKLAGKLQKIEEEQKSLKTKIEAVELQLASDGIYDRKEEFTKLSLEHGTLQAQLLALDSEWESVYLSIEMLENA